MGGSRTMNYVTGPAQMIAGAAATYMGAPEIGVPLIMGGAGQLTGTAAGGTTGGGIGEVAGLGLGSMGQGYFGGTGPFGGLNPGNRMLGGIASGATGTTPGTPGAATSPLDQQLLQQSAQGLQSLMGQGGGGGAGGGLGGLGQFASTPGGGAVIGSGINALTRPPQQPMPPTVPPLRTPQQPPAPPAGLATRSPAVSTVPGMQTAGAGQTSNPNAALQQLALLRLLGGSMGA